jgi:hypothetical protein
VPPPVFTFSPFSAVAVVPSVACAQLSLVAVASLLSNASASLSLVAVASLLFLANARLLFVAVASLLLDALAPLLSVAVAWLLFLESALLLFVAVASLLSSALAKLEFLAVALLLSVACASLPLWATAWEVESDEQLLVPFCTLVSPLLLTHTSAPWARAAPERAIIPTTTRVARVANINHLAFTNSSLRRASNYTREPATTPRRP